MNVFRLEPVESMLSSHSWSMSTLSPVTVWVLANDEESARQKITLATITGNKSILGRENAFPPWQDATLVSCVIDDNCDVPDGVVMPADGKLLPFDKLS